MYLLDLFRRHDENTRNSWGYIFQWTDIHQTPEQYNHQKYSYDTLAEECLDILNEISPPSPRQKEGEEKPADEPSEGSDPKLKPKSKPKRDLYILLRDNRSSHPKLQQLWDEVTTTPSWVDWDQIARGQEVFYRYGGATITGLAYQSLLGGMGAARVVEVLARTGGFNIKVARHRLFETTQHILECTRSLESIQPLGNGFASSLRVRLLHAAVRQRIMKLTATRPEYYSVEANGIPINDLDCIATIAVFSSTIIWQSLPRQGIFMRKQEILDYLALWRLIAHYTGTPSDDFATPERAKAIMESLQFYEFQPSDTSRLLARNIIRALENTPPAYASRAFLETNARWLNGNAMCDALGLGRPPLYYWILTGGQCLFYMAIAYTYRSIPSWDRRKIAGLRKAFWEVIVEHKEWGMGGITTFDFKYVPGYDVGTDNIDEKEAVVKRPFSVERRSLNTLLVAGSVVALGTWAWWKTVTFLWRKVF